MKEIFCYCDHCNKPIYVGDTMVSVTLSTDLVDSVNSVQPLKAESIAAWCKVCASIAMKDVFKIQ